MVGQVRIERNCAFVYNIPILGYEYSLDLLRRQVQSQESWSHVQLRKGDDVRRG
jgi:hypothetical protein